MNTQGRSAESDVPPTYSAVWGRDADGDLTEQEQHPAESGRRTRIVAQLRFLSAARSEYYRGPEPQHSGDLDAMRTGDLLVWAESKAASLLADVIAGENDAKGWLPSWLWDEWEELTSSTPPGPDAPTLAAAIETTLRDTTACACSEAYCPSRNGAETVKAAVRAVLREWGA